MSDATHSLYIAHGHDLDEPTRSFDVTEAESVRFVQQMMDPQGPVVTIREWDGVVHGLLYPDVRYFSITPFAEEIEAEGETIIPFRKS